MDQAFKPMSDEDWRAIVEKELKGKSFEDYLRYQLENDIAIDAWQSESSSSFYPLSFRTTPWRIVEPIYTQDPKEANAQALTGLNAGAEGVLFNHPFTRAEQQMAQKEILVEYAPIIQSYVHADHSFFSVSEGDSAKTELLDVRQFSECGTAHSDQLAFALSQFIELKEKLPSQPLVGFHITVGSAFLAEIAKLRALRLLLEGVLSQLGISSKALISVGTTQSNKSLKDPYTNIIRQTSESLSAVLGGADYVSVTPWDEHSKTGSTGFSRRISRNVQVLLKEEGHIGKVLNPLDGAYSIERLTQEIARSAWKKVQQIENGGGYSKLESEGWIESEISNARALEIEKYSTGERELIGVSKYRPQKPESEEEMQGFFNYNLPFEIDQKA